MEIKLSGVDGRRLRGTSGRRRKDLDRFKRERSEMAKGLWREEIEA